MNLNALFNQTVHAVKGNAPEILTALGITGVMTTSYLVGKASFKASRLIDEAESKGGTHSDPKERFKERTKLVWKAYVPATVSGAATVACIVGASRASGRRTAAAVTAYSLTERAFSEYKEKVAEQFGANKERKVRDEIAQDIVNQNPPGSREIVTLGDGHVLCCELHTRRYFRSDMEALRKAQNDINVWVINSFGATLSDFYTLIGLEPTSESAKLGWESDRLMELEFSTVLSDNNEPCLAFNYNYLKPLE